MEREKALQQRYAELQAKLEELQEALQTIQQEQQNTAPEVVEDDEQTHIEAAYELVDGQQNYNEAVVS